ncbi:MAG: hypothetical protein P8N24_01390 [Hellea sp.]|nr:hypothetical protein [Hellea sp.]
MSLKDLIIQAGERYASLTSDELHKEAHIFGKFYEASYFAAAKDIVKMSSFLKSTEAPALKVAKALYTMVMPFSSIIIENAQELRQEFEDEYESSRGAVKEDEVVVEDEAPEQPTPKQVTPEQAITTADLAAGTVRRGIILSRAKKSLSL